MTSVLPSGAERLDVPSGLGAARSLEDALVGRGLVPVESLARACLVRDETGDRLEAVLTRLGLIEEHALARLLGELSGLALADPAMLVAAHRLTDLPAPSARFLRDQRAIPIARTDDAVTIAVASPGDGYAQRALAFAFGLPVHAVLALPGDIEAALDRVYGVLDQEADPLGAVDSEDLERLKDLASDAPAIRAVNRLITRAVEMRASDIHLEPVEDSLLVRYRIDGVMTEMEPLSAAMKLALISRIKVSANLNIAERRLPQDGRMRMAVRGRDVDLRVATSPSIHGESVVLRLLDRSNLALDLDALGFDPAQRDRFLDIVRRPHGIVLVTGPTGSGKTTTLYAALSALNLPDRKILTIEDPIEYRLPGVVQTQVAPAIGLTFASALRSFLRQDPDVMMVGEIRDLETAQVAVQASLTGHAILSTLHTNSAASAVARLMDMGVEPFLITSTLNAVLSQRLVRKLCAACRTPYLPPHVMLVAAGLEDRLDGVTLYRPTGCPACAGSGYAGRVAIIELLVIDDRLSTLVLGRVEGRDLKRAAVEGGMRTLLDDGLAKAAAGLTTLEEVLRVTREN
jgi:general secretion pathway protein E